MNIKRVVVGFMRTNCYIVFGKEKALLIDPGFDHERIENHLAGYPVEKIILTHGHLDHYYDMNYFRDKYHPTVYIHRGDQVYLQDFSLRAPEGLLDWMEAREYAADVLVGDGDAILFDGMVFQVIHTPGHTPGGICLLCESNLFSGDTLFQSTVGRTDLPLGDITELSESVHKLVAMDENIRVYPGHGLSTTIGREKQYYL